MRSLFLIRAEHAAKLAQSLELRADAIVLDLAACAGAAERERAGEAAIAFLREASPASGRPRLFVRVGSLLNGSIDDDLAAVMPGGPAAILLPDAIGGAAIQHLGAKLVVHEARSGLADGVTRIIAEIGQSAAGCLALASLVGSSRRLAGLAWNPTGLAAELGTRAGEAEPLRVARSLTLLTAVSAGVMAIDAVPQSTKTADAFAQACRAARRDGFTGNVAIDAQQVAIINEVFGPGPVPG
jgi:citrate lyase subunit beta/citryl-CoA lyase